VNVKGIKENPGPQAKPTWHEREHLKQIHFDIIVAYPEIELGSQK